MRRWPLASIEWVAVESVTARFITFRWVVLVTACRFYDKTNKKTAFGCGILACFSRSLLGFGKFDDFAQELGIFASYNALGGVFWVF